MCESIEWTRAIVARRPWIDRAKPSTSGALSRVRIVDARFVRTAHRRGIAVHVWTIDEPAEMHRLLDLGVDGIMTDRPEVLRDVLVERGEWIGWTAPGG